jgi:hypothetical protein
MDIAQFRINFPEFSDVERFTDAMLNFWAGIGENLISECRFGTSYNYALSLFLAHNIVLAATNEATADAGGIAGGGAGTVQQKTVGSVSVSYDVASSMLPDAGHWNQTIYGRQYLQLVKLFGQGCVHLA